MAPKPGNKELRPLTIVNPREKIVQKAIQVVLEALWEPEFLECSYGFSPLKTLHQALYQLYRNGSSYKWVIQGDISKCFDKIPHQITMKLIQIKVKCEKTLQLIKKSLVAGHIDPLTGKVVKSSEVTPQGSILSPLLSNITLHELDTYMGDLKARFEKGTKRAKNKESAKIQSKIQVLQRKYPGSPEIKKLALQKRTIPSVDTHDPKFRRIMYLRYADDFVVLITGTSDEAAMIKTRIADILQKRCGLDLNQDKTAITAIKDGFKFVGA